MGNKTFTEKLIELLISGGMPSAKGKEAMESGLIIAISKTSTPVCASYGSGVEIGEAICDIIQQNQPIRAVLAAAVFTYAVTHPDDPAIAGLKDFITDVNGSEN